MPSRRVRQHANPLRSDLLCIRPDPVVVPAGRPLEVELGSAEGWFLFSRADEAPEGHYIGIEIRHEIVKKANAAARVRGYSQVNTVFANMTVDLERLFEPQRVSRFFLNFPDPWFKSKQHKRRVADPELVASLMRVLRSDGEVYVNTDIFDIALDALAALESEPGLVNMAGAWRFLRANPFAAQSRRERQCLTEGRKIWRLGFRRTPGVTTS